MRLVVFSHKPCWPSGKSCAGIASNGGFPLQMQALSELFDETRMLLPLWSEGPAQGELPITGKNVVIVPLTQRRGRGALSKLSFLPWLARNSKTILRELRDADAVHAAIPGDVGTVGMLLAWLFGKPLFVRHCGNWLRPVTLAEKFWRWFMVRFAGGQNVMLATGGTSQPPATTNPSILWIFASSLRRAEMHDYLSIRTLPPDGAVRLVIVARQEPAKGTGKIIKALPLLVNEFPRITLDVIGDGSAIIEYRQLAAKLGMEDRIHFAGQLDHTQVMTRLKNATVFVFPTNSSDGFPKAVLEGLASGLPIVATRVSVLPELLGNGCGVLIDEASAEAVANGVKQVLASAAGYNEMSRRAVAAAQNYSLEAWRDRIGVLLESAWGPLRQ